MYRIIEKINCEGDIFYTIQKKNHLLGISYWSNVMTREFDGDRFPKPFSTTEDAEIWIEQLQAIDKHNQRGDRVVKIIE